MAKPNANARVLALDVLTRIERDAAYAQPTIAGAISRTPTLSEAEQRQLRQIVYGVLQTQGALDHQIGQRTRLSKLEPLVLRILRIGVFQLLYSDAVPDHAAIHSTVALANHKRRRAAGLVNAVLRRLQREKDDLRWPPTGGPEALSAVGSLPPWLAQRWHERLGSEAAQALAQTLNEPPPGTVRVLVDPATLADRLGERHRLSPAAYAAEAWTITPFAGVLQHETFAAGAFAVQDEASMLISELLAPRQGELLLDGCAGPGGKTCHLAQKVGPEGRVEAVEVHDHRRRLIEELAQRLKIPNISTHTADLAEWDPGEPRYDGVLIDAPCTGLGTLRRRPELKWRFDPENLQAMPHLQGTLLAAGARWVRPGGRLVYATCSTEPEEGEGVVRRFLEECPEFVIEAPQGEPWSSLVQSDGSIRTWPHLHGMDGFYGVRLRKRQP